MTDLLMINTNISDSVTTLIEAEDRHPARAVSCRGTGRNPRR